MRNQTNTTKVRHMHLISVSTLPCELNDRPDNCKKIRPQYHPTTVQMSELKALLEMTTTRLHTSWKTSTPLTHSCSNDGVIQFGPLSSDAMFEVIDISDACFVHLLLQDSQHAVVNRI